jgi:hypothetical protein
MNRKESTPGARRLTFAIFRYALAPALVAGALGSDLFPAERCFDGRISILLHCRRGECTWFGGKWPGVDRCHPQRTLAVEYFFMPPISFF